MKETQENEHETCLPSLLKGKFIFTSQHHYSLSSFVSFFPLCVSKRHFQRQDSRSRRVPTTFPHRKSIPSQPLSSSSENFHYISVPNRVRNEYFILSGQSRYLQCYHYLNNKRSHFRPQLRNSFPSKQYQQRKLVTLEPIKRTLIDSHFG